MNYSSWAVVGLTFGSLIRKRVHGWWSTYNFVLSSDLDSSVGIEGVVTFSDYLLHWGEQAFQLVGSRNLPGISIPQSFDAPRLLLTDF
jgi:hypothetical protein